MFATRLSRPLPVALLAVAFLSAIPAISRAQSSDLVNREDRPADVERDFCDAAARFINQQEFTYGTAEAPLLVRQAFDRLAKVSPITLRLRYVADDRISIWVSPTGDILFSDGAFNALGQDETAIAGAMAHGLAHAVKRHTILNVLKAVNGDYTQQQILSACRTDSYLFMREFADEIGSFDSGQEAQADSTARDYLLKARYVPNAANRVRERLRRIPGDHVRLLDDHLSGREKPLPYDEPAGS